MSVKVSTVVCVDEAPKSYLEFEWTCTKCGATTTSDVVESTLFQYKKRSIGIMRVERKCAECGSKHSMELRL